MHFDMQPFIHHSTLTESLFWFRECARCWIISGGYYKAPSPHKPYGLIRRPKNTMVSIIKSKVSKSATNK